MSQHAQQDPRRTSITGLPPRLASFAILAVVIAVLGTALGIAAWAGPTTRPAPAESDSARSMQFSYTTTVPRSAAYDGTTVTSPDPIFREQADTVDVSYRYTGDPGSITVVAELSTASGWHSTVPLRPPVDFNDSRYTGSVRLDLNALEARAQEAAAATGIPTSQVDIAVVPRVNTSEQTTFTPALRMVLSPLQLTLVGDRTSLAVRESTVASTDATAARTLNLANRQLPVTTAKTLSLILTGGALLALAVIVMLARLRPPASEAAAIRRRYPQMLIEVEPTPTPAGRQVIDVVDFPTLAKLAERYELLVLHWSRSDVETFVVQDQNVTYRYRSGTADTTPPSDLYADMIQRASDR